MNALLHDKSLRGKSKTGWLDSAHSFSFGGFSDPSRMGHRRLRVLNDDHVIPGAGFPTHSHQDMDIVTYVISGALAHKDSLGTEGVIKPGEIQAMTAGTGITHSEMNASDDNPVHFLQIWIVPEQRPLEPRYQQKSLPPMDEDKPLQMIAGPDEGEHSVKLYSDTSIYLGRLAEGQSAQYDYMPGRAGFIQIISGAVEIAGETLSEGDGLQFEDVRLCEISAKSDTEFLLFDLG